MRRSGAELTAGRREDGGVQGHLGGGAACVLTTARCSSVKTRLSETVPRVAFCQLLQWLEAFVSGTCPLMLNAAYKLPAGYGMTADSAI